MKGIVFDIVDGRATILKNDGGFAEVAAKPGWQTGDLVTVQARRIRFPVIIAAAASLLLAFGALFTVLAVSGSQAALISLDINPSMELGINRFGRVISAVARNDEGAAVLETVEVDGMTYDDAVLRLMEDGAVSRYLAENGLLVFSVQADNPAWREELFASLRRQADGYLSAHHGGATAEYFMVDGRAVGAAHRHGVTAGKYMLLLELESLAPDIDIEEYAHHSVADIQSEINGHHRHGAGQSAPPSGGAEGEPDTSPSEAPESQSQADVASQPGGHERNRHGEGHNDGHE